MNTNISIAEIENLASGKNVRKIAVENFLISLPIEDENAEWNAYMNLNMDARLYKWNIATKKAIKNGIRKTFIL